MTQLRLYGAGLTRPARLLKVWFGWSSQPMEKFKVKAMFVGRFWVLVLAALGVLVFAGMQLFMPHLDALAVARAERF